MYRIFKQKWNALSGWPLLFGGCLLLQAFPAQGKVPADTASEKKPDISLRFSGYVQPQFQVAEAKGIRSFSGGNFTEHSSDRFMLRRGRLKASFETTDTARLFRTTFTFQIDATERGVATRDIYGELSEQYFGALTLTAGLFVRPFGYEVTYSSQRRETPERGRMSQLLMKTERDVGAMLSVHPKAFAGWQLDVGVFNGPGLSAPADYDSHKDVIGRLHYKSKSKLLGAGISGYYGHITSDSTLVYTSNKAGTMTTETTLANAGRRLPRRYLGADAQWRIPNKNGFTELRAEVMGGLQTGTRGSSETPGSLAQPLAERRFLGGYFYLLQHLGSEDHQVVLKYDFYDPNRVGSGKTISTDNGFNAADIAYQTFGAGYVYYLTEQLKMTLWYDLVRNEATELSGYSGDLKDDVLTLRLQFQF